MNACTKKRGKERRSEREGDIERERQSEREREQHGGKKEIVNERNKKVMQMKRLSHATGKFKGKRVKCIKHESKAANLLLQTPTSRLFSNPFSAWRLF